MTKPGFDAATREIRSLLSSSTGAVAGDALMKKIMGSGLPRATVAYALSVGVSRGEFTFSSERNISLSGR